MRELEECLCSTTLVYLLGSAAAVTYHDQYAAGGNPWCWIDAGWAGTNTDPPVNPTVASTKRLRVDQSTC
ncbi:hypothetical protein OH77DRAFT_1424903 [Trametes cingulata]|nr:hypothetical protein OH77DRAFT_1424903 [Trametes cingulata]